LPALPAVNKVMFYRNKKTIVIFLILCLGVIVMTGLGCRRKGEKEELEILEPELETPSLEALVPGTPSLPTSEVPGSEKTSITEEKLKSLAEDFAAVWGTYSSESNCQNIQELLGYMTEDFREEMQEYIENQCVGSTGANFTWETEVLDSVILDNDGDQVDVLVVTFRWRDGDYVQSSYSNLILDLRVETSAQGAEEWKVDSAYWAE